MNNFEYNYSRSRSTFRELAAECGATVMVLPLALKGEDTEFFIDIATLGEVTAPRKVFVIAGTHGVEAPVGHAVQQEILKIGLLPPNDTTMLLLHCLNPWGMQYGRRVNHSNVDLNRNAIFNEAERCGAPQHYNQVRELLMPNKAPQFARFCVAATMKILALGFDNVKQAVTGGQYEDELGLFFGGRTLQPELWVFQDYLSTLKATTQEVRVVDIHSGLGPFGTEVLLMDAEPGSGEYLRAAAMFGADNLQGPDPTTSIAYYTKGSLSRLFHHVFADHATVTYVCHEFGTRSALRVLHGLVAENARYHRNEPKIAQHRVDRTDSELFRLFCPNDKDWCQRVVVPRGLEVCRQALTANAAVS